MANQDLVESIQQRFSHGESKESIRQFLFSEGWESEDIDAAFANLPLAQPAEEVNLPYSSLLSTWDAKTAHLSPSLILAVFGLIACIVLLIAVLLYNLIDPLGSRAVARDRIRDSEFSQAQKALQKYFETKNSYPQSLIQLVPNYLTVVPLDPLHRDFLTYHITDDVVNYELCADFETRPPQCYAPSPSTSSLIPTITSPDLPISVLPTVSTSGFVITGKVFIDYNENGTQDNGEPAFSNASLSVVDGSDTTVCVPHADSFGSFLCSISTAGVYSVTLNIPARYRITVPNPQSVTFSATDPEKTSVALIFGLAPIDSVPAQQGFAPQSNGAR